MEIDLRDHFATHSPFTLGESIELLKTRYRENTEDGEPPRIPIQEAIQYLAQLNYAYADNMLRIREYVNTPKEETPETEE